MYGFANVYRQQWEAEGEARGLADGLLRGGQQMFVSLVREGALSIAKAVAKAKVTQEEFEKIMDDYPETEE